MYCRTCRTAASRQQDSSTISTGWTKQHYRLVWDCKNRCQHKAAGRQCCSCLYQLPADVRRPCQLRTSSELRPPRRASSTSSRVFSTYSNTRYCVCQHGEQNSMVSIYQAAARPVLTCGYVCCWDIYSDGCHSCLLHHGAEVPAP